MELREKLSISEDQLPDALSSLKARDPISECLILSTCNRTELYACAGNRADDESITDFLSEYCGISRDTFASHLYSHAGHKAAEHLFSVASGIDSMVLGEDQILGQVKSAYSSAAGSTGTVLNVLFQQAITVGKRARTETEIGRGAFSVGSAAVQLARSIFDDLKGRTVLIVGAGEMGEITTAHLVSSGASEVLVANRTGERAVSLASQFGGKPVGFEDLTSALEAADIVITSTGSREPVVTREMVSFAMRVRRGRPVFFIDIAVPRDIEPGVGDLDNVFVYDMDDLQAAVTADTATREAEVEKVEKIVLEEVEEFMRWFRTLDAVPVITALREKFENIRRAELEKLKGKLPNLSEEDLEAIEVTTRSIMNKICHQPMIQIKDYATGKDSAAKLEIICKVFGVCPLSGEMDGEQADGD